MTARIRNILHWLSTLIDGFQPAEGPPPRMLWPFMRWCLAGAWPVIVLAPSCPDWPG
jgi:ATP-binding cassette subfamily B protein